jgi:type IV secretory pathway VirB10-like protein
METQRVVASLHPLTMLGALSSTDKIIEIAVVVVVVVLLIVILILSMRNKRQPKAAGQTPPPQNEYANLVNQGSVPAGGPSLSAGLGDQVGFGALSAEARPAPASTPLSVAPPPPPPPPPPAPAGPAPGTPAGWLPDPSGAQDTLRYWDGSAWTQHVAQRS